MPDGTWRRGRNRAQASRNKLRSPHRFVSGERGKHNWIDRHIRNATTIPTSVLGIILPSAESSTIAALTLNMYIFKFSKLLGRSGVGRVAWRGMNGQKGLKSLELILLAQWVHYGGGM